MMSVMLMLALGSLAANAQDSGAATNSTPATNTSVAPATPPATSTGGSGTTVYHSSSSESTQDVQGLSTNTWILIAIGAIGYCLILLSENMRFCIFVVMGILREPGVVF